MNLAVLLVSNEHVEEKFKEPVDSINVCGSVWWLDWTVWHWH